MSWTVDTAERLDLAVLDSLEKEVINTLPGKVEGDFTVNEVVSRSKSFKLKHKSSTFSATATPFVPGGKAYVPSSTPPPPGEKNSGVTRDQSDSMDVFVKPVEKGADGAEAVQVKTSEADMAKAATVGADKVKTATVEAGQANPEDDKQKRQGNDSALAEAEFEEVALDADLDADNDLELPELTTTHVVDVEESSPPTPWPKTSNGELASNLVASATMGPDKPENSEPQFDNLLKMIATEKREEEKQKRKKNRSCYANIQQLLGFGSW
ncbi:hypothetical protein O1611_g7702 [Lasiodiplodia mahajangana]|uniref:Uncharacterized protein n=1 Tax=Lasiodiplodia mahajangana TaxID=1108764 RepID=A0ACC2JEQ6_9PEZI|nr:hypothetical protein O1611_g7702 [Lasiodiplodia mahajangana]